MATATVGVRLSAMEFDLIVEALHEYRNTQARSPADGTSLTPKAKSDRRAKVQKITDLLNELKS